MKKKKKKNIIRMVDVTNRDGVQTSRVCLSKLQKTMINIYLNEMGVYQSEFSFPMTSHEANYIEANLQLVHLGVLKPIMLSGWIRAIVKDVDAATKNTKIQNLHLSISTSKQMIEGKFQGRVNKKDVVKMMTEAVDLAKKRGVRHIGVNAEDASRSDLDYLVTFAKAAKEHGATRLRYCDTLGYDDPFTIYKRISYIVDKVKIPIGIHCHNDLGLVVATSIAGAKAAIDSGVDAYVNTTVNGTGERAGNADLVSVILALRYSSGFAGKYKLDPKINLSKAWKIASYASRAFGIPIPINQPGVGANAFAHESGIHADGALKDRRNYELYDFEELGRGKPEVIDTGRKITAGEYSGIKGFRNVYERLEVKFDNEKEAAKILELVRYANIHNQSPLAKDELKFISTHPEIAKKLFTMSL